MQMDALPRQHPCLIDEVRFLLNSLLAGYASGITRPTPLQLGLLLSMTLVNPISPPFGRENLPQLIKGFPNTYLDTVRRTVACSVLSTNVLPFNKSFDSLYQQWTRGIRCRLAAATY
jgi:hypothetical protein